MADETKVGGIVFDISAPTTDVEKAGVVIPRIFSTIEGKVSGNLSGMLSAVKATVAGFIAQFGARALLSSLDALLEKQKQLRLESEALGVSVKDLSAYQYALKSVGIEGEATCLLYTSPSPRD